MMPAEVPRYLERLAACGWFEALPSGAAQAARDGVAGAVAEGKEPWVGLVSATPDSMYLLDEQPYTALLLQFAAASDDVFQPDSVREEIEPQGVRFSFRAAGRQFVRSLPIDAFDVPDSFFETINEALEAAGTPLRFLQIHDLGWGPIPGFALTTPEAHRAAAAAKLIAAREPSGDFSDEELAGIAATLTTAMMGRETYYWTLEGQTLLEMQVPGGFDAEDTDARKTGDGVHTVLGYDNIGTVVLQCAEPVGEHLNTPREIKITGRTVGDDRLTQTGRARISGAEMAWRQDSLKELPIHAMYCVRKELEEPFAKALDSVRMLEGSPERDALFQSCVEPPPPRMKEKKKAAKKRRARN
jgi:hypothetical protein